MRRRINRTLLTATAASVSVITLSFMATGAVGAATTTTGLASGASSVTPISPPGKATACAPTTTAAAALTPSVCSISGYEATGRLFRYASASIVVPAHNAFVGTSSSTEQDPALYVALDNSGTASDYTRVGIVPCAGITADTSVHAGVWPCPGTVTLANGGTNVTAGWYVFATAMQPDSGVVATYTHLLGATQQGLGVSVSAYLSPSGNSVHTVIKTPTTYNTGSTTVAAQGYTYNDTFLVSGPTYTNAQAVADWSGDSSASSGVVVPFQPAVSTTAGALGTIAYAQFFQGHFTTWNGYRGTFDGKWAVNMFEATLDGTSGTAVVTSPGYLWSNDKFPHDAFGIWIRHS
jgi:hypothetical protein